MKLVSMARTAQEKKAAEERYKAMEPAAEEYPYGLCITLGKDELAKLGVAKLPPVGEAVYLYVATKVTRVSASASEQGDDSQCVDLQITQMALEEPPVEEKAEDGRSPAERLYGKK